ncbi:MAG TPA: ribonuclease Z [Gaiellales bacterium]|jgi:ribonuclease Z
MDLSVLFLGTAASAPTSRRGLAAHLIRRGGDRILVDCGEGTQRQLLRSGAGLVDVDDILLTHCHADHFLGLPGLLKTFGLRAREAPLHLYGPKGLRALMRTMDPLIGRLPFPFAVEELHADQSLARDGYRIVAFPTDHGIASLGYALVEDERPGRFDLDSARRLGVPEGPMFGQLQHGHAVTLESGETIAPADVVGETRPGRRIVMSGDTRPCRPLFDAALGADLLVHEATFLEDERDRAAETGHTTAKQAAGLARDAGVHLLALTHISTRYLGREIAAEAAGEFPDTVVPRDFDAVDLPLPERDRPHLLRGGERLEPSAAVPAPAG